MVIFCSKVTENCTDGSADWWCICGIIWTFAGKYWGISKCNASRKHHCMTAIIHIHIVPRVFIATWGYATAVLFSLSHVVSHLLPVGCSDVTAFRVTLTKTEDINKHLPYLEAPGLPGDWCIFFLSSMFSVNRSLDKKSLERLSPWLACHYH